jgi:Zn-dependent peptidase ImmA (M78 family)
MFYLLKYLQSLKIQLKFQIKILLAVVILSLGIMSIIFINPLFNKNQVQIISHTHEILKNISGDHQGKFQVSYTPLQRKHSIKRQERLQQYRSFEKLAQKLTQVLMMPNDVKIILGDCGAVNAYYKPSEHSINICYELIDRFTDVFRKYYQAKELNINQPEVIEVINKVNRQVAGTTVFTFFHELGHTLIEELDLPVTGKEEDTVDEFSTIFLAESGQEYAALASAIQFGLSGNREMESVSKDLSFWDEHSLNYQRFYNIICLVYGKNPEEYEILVNKIGIPEQRQTSCRVDYKRKLKAWRTLLNPHLKDGVNFL